MRSLVAHVGRLQRLAVFEAAARTGSFTAAASELGTTQPAVTQQIRALEGDLGVTLFDRGPNRVDLTDAGRRLAAAADQAFTTLELELGRLSRPAVFTLAANPGVAQRWLVPFLDGLQGAVGDSEVRLWLFDRNRDLRRGQFDAAIHAGDGHWPGFHAELLFPEVVVPVATPEVAARFGLEPGSAARHLVGADLIHLDDDDRSWMSWSDWFGHHGVDPPPSRGPVVYSNYALVLQAALAGAGVALGWRYMIDDALERGALVAVGPEARPETIGWYLLAPVANRHRAVDGLSEWLTDLIGA